MSSILKITLNGFIQSKNPLVNQLYIQIYYLRSFWNQLGKTFGMKMILLILVKILQINKIMMISNYLDYKMFYILLTKIIKINY